MIITGNQVVRFGLYCAIKHQIVRRIIIDKLVMLRRYNPLCSRRQFCDGVVDELYSQTETRPLEHCLKLLNERLRH